MTEPKQLERRLGLFSATTIVVGSMIGSGIFIAPAIMAAKVPTPGILLGLWLFGGLFTILGALAYAELAAMIPHAGGQYVYLREAFGPFWGFLYGWTLFLVIQTGFNAAVSIAFAKYLGVFIEALGEDQVLFELPLFTWNSKPVVYQLNSAQLVGCAVIIVLTLINIRGVSQGAFVQNLFTVLKVGALLALIVAGFAKAPDPVANLLPFWPPGGVAVLLKAATLGLLAGAMSKALFAYDSWNTATFVAEEVREPQRTLPRSLLLGVLVTTAVYVSTTAAYLANLSFAEMASVKENRVADAVAERILPGLGSTLIVIAILISTFGCVNGLILGGARVCYAMARDSLFFRSCARLHATRATPAVALVYQGVWSCVLAVSGSFDALLTYTTFASVLFGALTVLGVFQLRRAQPDRPRPYRCWGYPVTPVLYLLIALPFLVYVIYDDYRSAGAGLLLVLTGIPMYFWLRASAVPRSPEARG
jgi:basic amino acid/polyamine antiporter, APA family